jgi:DNA polymerase III epsilon subunit-like protein
MRNGVDVMKKVTYFDVEYANSNNKSICQLGLMCEDYNTSEPFYPERNVYIDPEDGFDDFCIKIHGITADKVKKELSFPAVWKQIEQYFTNAVVIGHNVASADLDALVKNLRRYNIDIPEFYYICTLDLAREFIPQYTISNYSMSSLCAYFDIDIDNEHNAFDDACANSDLLKALVETYHIDIENHIKKYTPHETEHFTQYIASPVLRKSISEFYGIIRGFSIDNHITSEEAEYIAQWQGENNRYSRHKEIADILKTIDKILNDGMVTIDEIIELQATVKNYLSIMTSSPITLATQILDGIMKGIIIDGKVTEGECRNLRQWLYDNIYLAGHYPFDKVIKVLEEVLLDGVVTQQESDGITAIIKELLNPIESLKAQVNSVNNKHVCLSGNFAYGQKSAVEKYIIGKGGIIDSAIKKSTNVLLIGDYECQAYSNGTYGTKVKKALEYNEKGCGIQVLKESDFFTQVK